MLQMTDSCGRLVTLASLLEKRSATDEEIKLSRVDVVKNQTEILNRLSEIKKIISEGSDLTKSERKKLHAALNRVANTGLYCEISQI
jgi:hypothetical protein